MTEYQLLIDYLMLLRFGHIDDPTKPRPKLNYASIAKLTKKNPETVRSLIKLGLKLLRENKKSQRIDRFKLKEEHISFLTNQ